MLLRAASVKHLIQSIWLPFYVPGKCNIKLYPAECTLFEKQNRWFERLILTKSVRYSSRPLHRYLVIKTSKSRTHLQHFFFGIKWFNKKLFLNVLSGTKFNQRHSRRVHLFWRITPRYYIATSRSSFRPSTMYLICLLFYSPSIDDIRRFKAAAFPTMFTKCIAIRLSWRRSARVANLGKQFICSHDLMNKLKRGHYFLCAVSSLCSILTAATSIFFLITMQ